MGVYGRQWSFLVKNDFKAGTLMRQRRFKDHFFTADTKSTKRTHKMHLHIDVQKIPLDL